MSGLIHEMLHHRDRFAGSTQFLARFDPRCELRVEVSDAALHETDFPVERLVKDELARAILKAIDEDVALAVKRARSGEDRSRRDPHAYFRLADEAATYAPPEDDLARWMTPTDPPPRTALDVLDDQVREVRAHAA